MPLLLITLLGAALRFYGLGHQGFWYDEAYTVVLVKLPLGRMLGRLPEQESTPPLYYGVAWIWTRIFGPGQAGLRSLSALCGTATIPVAYAGARKLLSGRRAALIVAALTAFNPLLIWYSQEARAYQMMVLLSACSLLAFAHARAQPRPRLLALWALASAVALCTHYYAILLVAPEAAWLLYEHRRREVRVAIGGVAAVGAALLPLLIAQNATGNNAWIARSSLSERLAQVIPLSLLGPQAPARVLLKFVAFALVLGALALLVVAVRRDRRTDAAHASGDDPRLRGEPPPAGNPPPRGEPRADATAWRGARLPALLTVSGLVLSLLMIPVSDTFLARNLLALWLPAALVVAAGVDAARARLLAGAITVALCAIGVTAAVGVAADHDLQRPNWQPVATLIGPPIHGGRLVVVLHNGGILPLGLYMPGLEHLGAATSVRVAEIDIVSVKDIRGLGGFCWWGSACNLSPSKLSRHYRLPGFRQLPQAHVEQFRVVKLVSHEPRRVTLRSLEHLLHHRKLKRDALLIQP